MEEELEQELLRGAASSTARRRRRLGPGPQPGSGPTGEGGGPRARRDFLGYYKLLGLADAGALELGWSNLQMR
jgi:hypothetical protein